MIIVWDPEDYAPIYFLRTDLRPVVARCLLRHWQGKGHVIAEIDEGSMRWRDTRYREELLEKCTVRHYFDGFTLDEKYAPKNQFWGELRNVATRDEALSILESWKRESPGSPELVRKAAREIESRWKAVSA